MSKAVFLDRDGVINEDTGYVFRQEDFRFLPGIFEFCRRADELGYLLIVVTNQAGIARGYYTEDDFLALNAWMTQAFAERGVRLTDTFYCPFHAEKGVGKYRRDSFDRKPNPGMVLRAQRRYGVDLSASVMVGDKESDMLCAERAGIGKRIFVRGKYPLDHAYGAQIAENLAEAEKMI